MKNYREKLRDLREDRDVKQSTLAVLLDTTQSNYSKYELGRSRLSIEDLKTLCEFYNVSADYLMGLPDGMPYPKD
ncbi:MAG: helix-turn-helix transcriptional regulator [Oscillospiraceae bacterium]|nr:helix-turn-helix transcriptional regulator [Oscillospiraceae bacterium]